MSETVWNIADMYEAIARQAPNRPCQIQGERVVTWGEFDRRADALAADFIDAGLTHQSKVAATCTTAPSTSRR